MTTFVRVSRGAVLIVATLALSFGGAEADAPSVSGALYKLGMGAQHSQPVRGASVYVHAAGQPATAAWIGPNLTDQYGRFAIYNLAPGQYLLRIFSSTIRLWQQTFVVPPEAKLGSIVIPDVRLVYFAKPGDADIVAETLENLGLPYDSEPPKSTVPTNAIWFGDSVPLEDVRKVSLALLAAHVRLQAILRFSVSNDWHAKILEVGSSSAVAGKPAIGASAINEARTFPRATGPSEDQL